MRYEQKKKVASLLPNSLAILLDTTTLCHFVGLQLIMRAGAQRVKVY